TYDRFNFDYSLATPPVEHVPACGRALVGLQAGHRFFQSNPQVLEVDATAYARLTVLRLSPVFGSSLRLASENATYANESFPGLRWLQLVPHDAQSLKFVASVRGLHWEGALEAVLTPGSVSTLSVRMRLYARSPEGSSLKLGIVGMSSMFWKRDADTP